MEVAANQTEILRQQQQQQQQQHQRQRQRQRQQQQQRKTIIPAIRSCLAFLILVPLLSVIMESFRGTMTTTKMSEPSTASAMSSASLSLLHSVSTAVSSLENLVTLSHLLNYGGLVGGGGVITSDRKKDFNTSTNTNNGTTTTAHSKDADTKRRTSTANSDTPSSRYPNDGVPVGVLSHKPREFFDRIRYQIDHEENMTERCHRYGFSYSNDSTTSMINRRIFYGAMMADEPWELIEIVAAESYGLFHAMVFVESKWTAELYPREKMLRLHHGPTLQRLFAPTLSSSSSSSKNNSTNKTAVLVLPFNNPDPTLVHFNREHATRAEILNAWKRQLDMQVNDVGLLADLDEIFSRDFLLAIKYCDGIEAFNYHDPNHFCRRDKVKISAVGLAFESSPECIHQEITNTANSSDRAGGGGWWERPDVMIGHCIQGIGNITQNPLAPRLPKRQYLRQKGWGKYGCKDTELEQNVKNRAYPLWNSADFRSCGGQFVLADTNANTTSTATTATATTTTGYPRQYSKYTAFHFHNFFTNISTVRFKYLTYAHPLPNALTAPFTDIAEKSLRMMYRCVMGLPDEPHHRVQRVTGGFTTLQQKLPLPIYFYDADYRARRHAFMKEILLQDERIYGSAANNNNNNTDKGY